MARDSGNVARPSGIHPLGHDAMFRARECVCRHGVRSPVQQGELGRAQISVILSGTFHARSPAGAGVVGPGALLLGNAGSGYETRHVVDGGDRSILFDYDAAVLDELGPRFRAAIVPASPAGAEAIVLAAQALRSCDGEALREAALAVALIAVGVERGVAAPPAPGHARRVARAIAYIEAHAADDCSLDALAGEARLSRFHFLRVFRAMTGQTPRQYVIATRLRAAATALRTTHTPITRVALEAGFGDLSHFAASFSLAFGASPRTYRRRAACPRGSR